MDYLDGDLSSEESDSLMSHVSQCQTCARILEEYRRQDAVLARYYDARSKEALKSPRPALGKPPLALRPARRMSMVLFAAAAALVLLVGGLAIRHYRNMPSKHAGIGFVECVDGVVQTIENGKTQGVMSDSIIMPGVIFKTAHNSYLSVGLAQDSGGGRNGVIEFKDNTIATFKEYADRTILHLDRGEVWVHITKPPSKPFLVQTRHMTIRHTGTIFNVTRGLSGTSVGVAEGSIAISGMGQERNLGKGEFFTTISDITGDSLLAHVPWSRHKDSIFALLGHNPAVETISATSRLLIGNRQSESTMVTDEQEPGHADNLTPSGLLPADSVLLIEFSELPSIVEDWNQSEYNRLFDDPEFVRWWRDPGTGPLRKFLIDDFGMDRWKRLITSIPGSLSVGMICGEPPLMIADCRKDPEAVRKVLDEDIYPLLLGKWDNPLFPGSSDPKSYVNLKEGFLVICFKEAHMKQMVEAIQQGTPTGFTDGAFYKKIKENVPESNMTMAYDFINTVRKARNFNDPALNKFCDRSGLSCMDYIMGSPDMSGKGLNHAFRLAFSGERTGVASWIDRPASLGSMRCFPPGVHLYASARIKSPHLMMTDVLTWIYEDQPNPFSENEAQMADIIHDMASALGNEAAFAVQNPLIPVPNIQLAVEILDPIKFTDSVLAFVDLHNAVASQKDEIVMQAREYRDQMIFNLYRTGAPFTFSYVVLRDYVIFGTSESYLRRAVDGFVENQSLLDDTVFQSLLQDTGRMNFSFLVYQNITGAMPDFLSRYSSNPLFSRNNPVLPDADTLKRHSAASISYGICDDPNLDFYINGTKGVDFSLGGILPMITYIINQGSSSEQAPAPTPAPNPDGDDSGAVLN